MAPLFVLPRSEQMPLHGVLKGSFSARDPNYEQASFCRARVPCPGRPRYADADRRHGGRREHRRSRAMNVVPREMRRRSGIVAVLGIFLVTITEASLIDPSRCRPASQNLSVAATANRDLSAGDDATRRLLSSRNTDGLRRACAAMDSLQRPRAVEPEFLNAVEIAGAQSPSN